jgi:hypothetical protein
MMRNPKAATIQPIASPNRPAKIAMTNFTRRPELE